MTNQKAAIKIIETLRGEGFQALLAGGCVRDKLLGRAAKDYDVVTDARPEDVIRIFGRTKKIGAMFGVVMVLMFGKQVEVATFRTESGYADGRHPDNVCFATAKEDALRRDFTVNGMFYDPEEQAILDYVGGRSDLEKRILRTIGEPEHRFAEDYLRMLRAVRFSTELEFVIEKETFLAIQDFAPKITRISGERIAMELETILTNPRRAEGANLLWESGLSSAIFKNYDIKSAKFGMEVLGNLPEQTDFALGLGGFFCNCDAKFVLEKCDLLKLSNAHIKHLKFLLDNRGRLLDAEMPLAQLKLLAHEPYFWDLYSLQKAIQLSQKKSTEGLAKTKKRALKLEGADLRPKPLLDGHELIGMGVQPGPMVGLVSQEMYIAQLGEEIKTKTQAKARVEEFLERHNKGF
jgi:poly(A) polymerase